MATIPQLLYVNPAGFEFVEPIKKIHDGPDVLFFLQSLAYRDITSFILQLNRSMVPRKVASDGPIIDFSLDQKVEKLPQIDSIEQLVVQLNRLIDEAPPDTGPRRFGNVSFRKWYQLVEQKATTLLENVLLDSQKSALPEIRTYLLGSFGSAQRLDYGTGHELSFIAFLACLWKIRFFISTSQGMENADKDAEIERQIVVCLFQPYLALIRKLIITYNLEPAGSHGVWGLDDNSFLPYLFGSAQLCPAIPEDAATPPAPMPTSGSSDSAPDPSIVTKQNLVEKQARSNLYFGAIHFIHTVKRGPFWEHSPMLFDISGIKDGWGKINKGLIKMYDAEVLGKFPVVQHFPFGGLLRWEKDPQARPQQQSTHTANQPLRDPTATGASMIPSRPQQMNAPWAGPTSAMPPPTGFVNGVTQAPWAKPGSTPATRPFTQSRPVRGFAIPSRRPPETTSRRLLDDPDKGVDTKSDRILKPVKEDSDANKP